METKANYVLIGAFVLLAAGALALFTLWIAGNPLNRSYADYDVIFEGPVNGLTEGGEVRFNGIKVGEVQTLRLDREDPNKVVARIRIDAQTPVRTDSVAQLNFMGITGVTFIQILAGDPKKPLLTSVNGQTPQIFTSRTLVDELFQGGQDLLGVSGDTIKKINEMLSDENLAHLTATLASIDKVAAKIAQDDGLIDSATSALKSIDKAAATIEGTAQSVDQALASISKDVNSVSTDASRALADLEPTLKDARTAMANVNGAVAQINTNLAPSATTAIQNIGHAATDIQSMMLRLQGLLAQIEQDPSRFVYQQPPPVER
ncbi:MAG TPA: MlaD family protein [Hyphomonadaceae bacterium]|nr:MlaD family protein [Hyphomonadaceae bacterium]HPN05356.1 MlaD family protein [Hyphomonadaceae bacterium]